MRARDPGRSVAAIPKTVMIIINNRGPGLSVAAIPKRIIIITITNNYNNGPL